MQWGILTRNTWSTYMARSIDNTDDYIDSRDVIERIEELSDPDYECDDDERAELAALQALAAQGESLDDWEHGVCLVRDSYFVRHAQELADDIGDTRVRNASWPYTCIDWDQAARELRMDYTALDFEGVTYYAR